MTSTVSDPYHHLDAVLLVNAGLHVSELAGFSGLSLDATVHNVLGTQYSQGGSTPQPYPQATRWFLATLAYQLDL